MNILVVSGHWTEVPGRGGVQSNVCTLAAALSQHHSVTVLVPRWQQLCLCREKVGDLWIYRRRIRSPQGSGYLAVKTLVTWLITLPGTLRDLRQVFREHQIEVVHLHQMEASQATFAVARLLGGPPYVATFHGRDVRDYPQRPWLQRLLLIALARGASAFTAVSEPLARLAEETIPGVRNVRVVRNGVSAPEESELGPEQGIEIPAKYFLCVGRLYPLKDSPLKGQDLVIRAWAKLPRTLSDLHLLLAGADAERGGYEELAAACGIADKIQFLGSLPRDRLFALMKGAIGIITASRSEGGSPTMTILEAGCLGLPLIASRIPAHVDFLNGGVDSLLVPAEDPDGIAMAVELVASDQDLANRLGEALRAKVQALGSATSMADGYVRAAYLPAIGRQRSAVA